jgi:hypothetical protein
VPEKCVSRRLVFIFGEIQMPQGYSLSLVSVCCSEKLLCIVYDDLGSKLVYIAAILLRFFSDLLLIVQDTGMLPRLLET